MSTSWVDSSLFFLFSNSFLKVSYSARHKSHGLFSHGMLPVPFPAKKKRRLRPRKCPQGPIFEISGTGAFSRPKSHLFDLKSRLAILVRYTPGFHDTKIRDWPAKLNTPQYIMQLVTSTLCIGDSVEHRPGQSKGTVNSVVVCCSQLCCSNFMQTSQMYTAQNVS